jgi:hypothetical protein
MRHVRFLVIPLIVIICFSGCKFSYPGDMKISELSGNWQFRQVGQQEWNPAIVPGTVHTAPYI